MVVVRVRQDDRLDQTVGYGAPQRVEMGQIVGAGVDDGDTIGAEQVAVGAGEGELARIGGRHPSHAGGVGHQMSGLRVELGDELEGRSCGHCAHGI